MNALKVIRPIKIELPDIGLESHVISKIKSFMALSGQTDIDATLRVQFENYLSSQDLTHSGEYLKGLDKLKLHEIESGFTRKLDYSDSVIYLGYYPDLDIASRFLYTAKKEVLFFDFSKNLSPTLKRQVFYYLRDVLEMDLANHHMIQYYITPVWEFYNTCSEPDVLLMKPDDVPAALLKHAFLNSPEVRWDANIWYLERFNFAKGRQNKTNPIEKLVIDNDYEREYLKYLLVISQKLSLTTIRLNHNHIRSFFKSYELTYESLERFAGKSSAKALGSVAGLVSFLETKKLIEPLNFPFDYYKSKTYYNHLDLSLSEEEIDRNLAILESVPENLRLMFLNLWCMGLRINEVCSIKSDSYLFDGKTAWFLIYQSKVKREKRIPIPYELYQLMTDYIRKNDIHGYVFTAPQASGPYRSSTFRYMMKKYIPNLRTHAYRHTVATDLYLTGASIQSIREYLGHVSMEMTKHYIDHLPNLIDKANEEYFKNNETISKLI